jgi:predicted peroxiredoxin
MKFVYMATRGEADPTLASIPLHLAANGSLEVGHEVAIVLAGDATDIMVGDKVDTIEGLGVPPLRELLGKLENGGATVFV